MSEKPVERLNYYNGQRLEARDFKLEQEYHIRVRRWLNKSLYTSGIARGLEVRAEPPSKPGEPKKLNVIVSPGLALDTEGREILLWEEERVPVQSRSGSSDATVEGNYLVIEYHEEKLSQENGGCTPRLNANAKAESSLAWGGPARIRAKPLLSWSSVLPHETSGKIVLAQVELEPGCEAIHQVNTRVRRYIGALSESKVRQFALDGEKHINPVNPGRIYFHIHGRQPNAVTLYLRAEEFSTLFYSEMGWHEHPMSLTGNTQTGTASNVDDHTHSALSMKTEFDSPNIDTTSAETETSPVSGQHTGKHEVFAHISPQRDPEDLSFWDILKDPAGSIAQALGLLNNAQPYQPNPNPITTGGDPSSPQTGYALRVITRSQNRYDSLKDAVGMGVFYGKHQHTVQGKTGTPEDKPAQNGLHTHSLTTSLTISKAGVDQVDVRYKARSGQTEKPLTFVNALQVWIGKSGAQLENKTDQILSQLRAANSTQAWAQLGLGTGSKASPVDTLAAMGTGPIKLDFLPDIAFTEGEYVIELRVASGGGRILYNLYVE